MKSLVFSILFLLAGQPLHADDDPADVVPFKEFFESVSAELDVPWSSVWAIAKTESGLNPWSLNIEGRSYRFPSKAEALARAEEAQRERRSFDIGLMQINYWWLERYGISLEAAFDPLANMYFGGWILKQELARHKNLRAAIGAYHSPDPLRASRYAAQVMKILAGEPASGQVPQSVPAVREKAPPAGFKPGHHSPKSMKVRTK